MMAEEKKKISFGFSKLVKKPSVIPAAQPRPAETVEFIRCVEDNNIQVLNEVQKEEEKDLVIPMKTPSVSSNSKEKMTVTLPENVSSVSQPQTLDELAAKEIVEEINKKEKDEEEKEDSFAVPLVLNPPIGEKESTLDDYENIPVEKYGLAMLRGMGWDPSKGIGKTAQIAPPVNPVLRPKGMGLGADKAITGTQPVQSTDKDLKLCKDCHVRLINGAHKDSYGKVEGFIEESGRVIVKLARGGDSVIVGEFMLSVVTPDEYSKNSKVINIAKFEKYKSDEKTFTNSVSDESDEDHRKESDSSCRQTEPRSSTSSHRSRYENGSSRHDDDRHRSRNDSDRYYDRGSSRRDYESKRNKSDHRHCDRESYHHKSSKSKKRKRDRSPRRD